MNYEELVKTLRELSVKNSLSFWKRGVCKDAAAAIEDLQAKIYELGESYSANLVAAQNAQPHWVSVEERLPKETKLVVTYGKSRVSFGYNILLYDADADKEVVEWFDYCGNKENVTHWMPLPEPPKEDMDGERREG